MKDKESRSESPSLWTQLKGAGFEPSRKDGRWRHWEKREEGGCGRQSCPGSETLCYSIKIRPMEKSVSHWCVGLLIYKLKINPHTFLTMPQFSLWSWVRFTEWSQDLLSFWFTLDSLIIKWTEHFKYHPDMNYICRIILWLLYNW